MPDAKYSRKEVAERGEAIYEQHIRANVESESKGQYLVLEIETGEYEIDQDDLVATKRSTLNRGIVGFKCAVLTYVNAPVTDIKRCKENDTSAIDCIFNVWIIETHKEVKFTLLVESSNTVNAFWGLFVTSFGFVTDPTAT